MTQLTQKSSTNGTRLLAIRKPTIKSSVWLAPAANRVSQRHQGKQQTTQLNITRWVLLRWALVWIHNSNTCEAEWHMVGVARQKSQSCYTLYQHSCLLSDHNDWLEVPLYPRHCLYDIIPNSPLHYRSPIFALNEDHLSLFCSHINPFLHRFSLSPSFLKILSEICHKPCPRATWRASKVSLKTHDRPLLCCACVMWWEQTVRPCSCRWRTCSSSVV